MFSTTASSIALNCSTAVRAARREGDGAGLRRKVDARCRAVDRRRDDRIVDGQRLRQIAGAVNVKVKSVPSIVSVPTPSVATTETSGDAGVVSA